jgi:glycosyltransferase involved in cell wall biosynthesis
MHIVHITPYYTPAYTFGGVVSAVEGLAQATAARGHQVTVLTTDALTYTERFSGNSKEILQNVVVIRSRNLNYALRRYNLSTPFGLRHELKHLLPSVDIIHLHEFRTVENLLSVSLARHRARPIVLSPHGTLDQSTGRSNLKIWWDRLISPHVARSINQIVALAEAEASDARTLWSQFGMAPQVTIIPNGVDPARYASLPDGAIFRQRYGLGEGPVVLFMGRLHRRKGVEQLTQAFRAAGIDGAKLVLAGPDEGMLPVLQRIHNDDIILTGYLNEEERREALAAADLFALPATGEGLSMAVLEAMAAGVAVLLSPGCNLPEAEQQGAGLVVPPQIEALTQALRTLLDDRVALQKMGERARHLVHERYTWAKVAASMESLYQQVQP